MPFGQRHMFHVKRKIKLDTVFRCEPLLRYHCEPFA